MMGSRDCVLHVIDAKEAARGASQRSSTATTTENTAAAVLNYNGVRVGVEGCINVNANRRR